MKFKKEDFREMVKNEIRKMIDDDMLRDPPVLGDPNYVKYTSADDACSTCREDPCECSYEEERNPKKLTCGACGGVLFMEGDCGCTRDVALYVPTHTDPSSDSHDVHDKPVAYMAKSQLYKLGKYAQKLQSMIPDDLDLDDWMRSHISQAADDIGEVYHKLDFQLSKEGN